MHGQQTMQNYAQLMKVVRNIHTKSSQTNHQIYEIFHEYVKFMKYFMNMFEL